MTPTLSFPRFDYFEQGNLWTGSLTKDRKEGTMVRGRIFPKMDSEGRVLEELQVCLWVNEDLCYELATGKMERVFLPMEESMEEIRAWFFEEYEKL